MTARQALPICVAFLLLGCGQKPIVPVSGQVFWKEKPLAGAYVYFQPSAGEGSAEPGHESYARTDSEGKFILRVVVLDQAGAVVGKHRVRISHFANEKKDAPDSGGEVARNTLPPRFNNDSELTFDVPPGGTDQAVFRLNDP